MFGRVDAEPVEIKFSNQVLVSMDQNIQYRPRTVLGPYVTLATRGRVVFNGELPVLNEITFYEAFW